MAMATAKIMRRSIYIFFQNYHYFTSTVALLLLPVSASILLSHVLESTSLSLQSTIEDRAHSIIYSAGLSHSNQFFSFLCHKLSRAICSSIMTLPFTLSFLLLAKAAIVQTLHHNSPLPPIFSSFLYHYKPLLLTQLCNTFFVFSGTATGLCIFFFALSSLDTFGFSPKLLIFLSAVGIVLYSIILSNTLVVCNLASVVAGTENSTGFLAIRKAYVLIKGRASTALSLALPVNFGLVALEALFQHRVVRANCSSNRLSLHTAFEGLLLAYLYSLVILLDTIMTCTFYKSCETAFLIGWA